MLSCTVTYLCQSNEPDNITGAASSVPSRKRSPLCSKANSPIRASRACHVTEVVLAPGGKSCRVFIAVQGDEQAEKNTLAGLMAARNFIRTEIRERMGVRHVPEMTFAIDRSEKINARMDEILGRAGKHREKIERRSAAAAQESHR